MTYWYPWYPTDFRRDTYHLSLSEEGAYRRLLDEYMINRAPLPDDDAALARIIGISIPDWATLAPRVRSFFKPQNGHLTHKRCDCELRGQNTRFQRLSERGKKAAQIKYNRTNKLDATSMPKNATLHNITIESSLNGAGAHKEQARKQDPRSLDEIIKAKGWAP